MKKFLKIFAITLLLVLVLTACSPAEEPTDEEPSVEEPTTEPEVEEP